MDYRSGIRVGQNVLIHGVVRSVTPTGVSVDLMVTEGAMRPVPLAYAAIRTLLPDESPPPPAYQFARGDIVKRKNRKKSRLWTIVSVKGDQCAMETDNELLVDPVDNLELVVSFAEVAKKYETAGKKENSATLDPLQITVGR